MMPITLGENSYGKSGIRLMKLTRAGGVGSVKELTVGIALSGDFSAVHEGDNSKCLPTDTMKNTVYALANDDPIDTIEGFAARLGEHFVGNNPQVSAATITIHQHRWLHGMVAGSGHPHFHLPDRNGADVCEVSVGRTMTTIRAGIADMIVLKSSDSAFAGYPKDAYTTLKETRDRLFCTSLTAWWTYTGVWPDFNKARSSITGALLTALANHKSESVQHTLKAMGVAALEACRDIQDIRLSMPNKHCLLVDLSPFGLQNNNEVFVPTDEPYGLIEATIERQ